MIPSFLSAAEVFMSKRRLESRNTNVSTVSMPYVCQHSCDLTDKPSISYAHTYMHVLTLMYLHPCVHICMCACTGAHTHFFGVGICILDLFNDSCSASVSVSSNDRLIGDISLVSVVRGFKVQRVK